ncbi:hypothetical protein [Paenibacillus agricola]|uniref:hypothetical protein n=1 Tax=Paenibacillus agricola TaxID=2716264 RepID=UPI001A9E5D04|nr:hypothetical protein [Paenibacillus agricola]
MTDEELAVRLDIHVCTVYEYSNKHPKFAKVLDMFNGELQPSWEERLSLTWENILALTRNFIHHNLNVIIDFVVEDDL